MEESKKKMGKVKAFAIVIGIILAIPVVIIAIAKYVQVVFNFLF